MEEESGVGVGPGGYPERETILASTSRNRQPEHKHAEALRPLSPSASGAISGAKPPNTPLAAGGHPESYGTRKRDGIRETQGAGEVRFKIHSDGNDPFPGHPGERDATPTGKTGCGRRWRSAFEPGGDADGHVIEGSACTVLRTEAAYGDRYCGQECEWRLRARTGMSMEIRRLRQAGVTGGRTPDNRWEGLMRILTFLGDFGRQAWSKS
ncbi:hypothetical protein DFH09DRAFT_1076872 [Mycena vulgaris]|nr:hypothetical protein DFH09DRAFT_1076872 [Mycena vulgaris]